MSFPRRPAPALAGTKPFRMPRKRRDNPEEQIQLEIAARLDTLGVLWCHVPNEGRTSKREGGRRKARGVKAGVPDILIFTPPRAQVRTDMIRGAVGAALELKAERGRLSEEQAGWLGVLAKCGWATAVTYGLEQALEQLRAWGYAV